MAAADRHPCGCTACVCSSTAHTYGDPCVGCRDGLHRPSERKQRHVTEGLIRWTRVMAPVTGSSGLSVRQVQRAADAWIEWHDRQDCDWEA